MAKKIMTRLWLKNLRDSKGWTFEEMAHRLGISSKGRYFSMETYGQQSILNIELVFRISEVFNVSVEWIADADRQWREQHNIAYKG